MSRLAWAAALLALSLHAGAASAGPSGGEAHGDDAHGEHAESHGPPLMPKIFNTLIFFGLLGWFAGPWVAAQLRTRGAEIQNELGAAQRAREEAEAKLAEVEARLGEVDGEVAGILEKAGTHAEAERQRILESAKVEAERILQSAEVQVGEVEKQASLRLREQAAALSVDLARGLVKEQLGEQDRAKLMKDYLRGLEKAAG